MKSTLVLAVTALLGSLLVAAPQARADDYEFGGSVAPTTTNSGPSPLQAGIDRVVPPLPLAPRSRSAGGREEQLWRAVLPSPTGDPFFDSWPSALATLRPGQLIEQRDVTAQAAPLMSTPLGRAVQLKFRSTSASGAASFGTAILLVPAVRWPGPGPRPVLVHALPINALGTRCTPGYTIGQGTRADYTSVLLPFIWTMLGRGNAVLLPDHEGPWMSYTEPTVAGHIMLDSIRAVRSMSPNQFHDSRFAIAGYSGGAIASYAAAMLLHDYAPELGGAVAGAAMGGLVTDNRAVAHHFNGNFASGILLAAALAVARQHPEMLPHMNHLAQWVAASPLKDACGDVIGPSGEIGLPIDVATDIDHSLESGIADELYRQLDLTDRKSAVPLYIYHGTTDVWIPIDGPRELYRRQCRRGVAAEFRTVPGDHVGAMLAGQTGADDWLQARLRGRPAPNDCTQPARPVQPGPPTS